MAQFALAALTGHAPGDWTARNFALDQFKVPSSLPMALPSALVHGRPDIMAAEMTYHAATAQIGVERSRLYPNLNITAQFAQTALSPDGLINASATGWSLATGLTAPLLNGGALKAKTRQAEAEAKRAQARYHATVLKAFVEVADGLEGVSASEAELRLRQSALTTAEENLRLVRRAYQLGSLRLVDVLDAQRQANGARQAFARTQGQRLLAYADLYAATATVSRAN
jgi:outer membrane protein TolC